MARPRTSEVYLVVDTRERAVIPFIEDSLAGTLAQTRGGALTRARVDFAHVVGQVNTGDYLICRRGDGAPAILAIIERKTLADFAASFKDGRHENIKKMLARRSETGCQLYYFVEGPAFPAPTRRYAQIPYAYILAAMTEMQVQHGIFVVLTENEAHTATRLADFLRAFDAKERKIEPDTGVTDAGAETRAVETGAVETGAVETKKPDAVVNSVSAEQIPIGNFVVPAGLTGLIEQSDGDAAMSMWACLRGISCVLAKILTQKFSVKEFMTGIITDLDIRALRTATGRPINKDAVASLTALRAGSEEESMRVLSGIRNITAATAVMILDQLGGLTNICRSTLATLEMVSIPQKTRTIRLGKARAERIRKILNYGPTSAKPAVVVAKPAVVAKPTAAVAAVKPTAAAPESTLVPVVTDEDIEEFLSGD